MTLCSLRNCDRGAHAHGFCMTHYQQMRRKGFVTPSQDGSPPAEADLIEFLGDGPILDGSAEVYAEAFDLEAEWAKHKETVLTNWQAVYPPWGWKQFETEPWPTPWKVYADGTPVPSSPSHHWAEVSA